MHTALYRKKRPKHFSNVIGQQAIVETLRNQLSSGNVSHAYLFCGTRGTGKTSVAKIFARGINCPHPDPPCNSCEICTDTLAERNLNVMEIDAASNNGVDNIRELRDEVIYPPTQGRFKVYIIDEAHMITTAAFNALLKTLEEPPPHVIFILATTDPQKVPATILSRCQRYDFKRIMADDMVKTLAGYMTEENITAEEEALRYIAGISDGAMRDALSILDQCASLYGKITLQSVRELLGAVDTALLFEYADALRDKNIGAALEVINTAAKEGRDLSRLAADINMHFRNLLVAGVSLEILDYAPEQRAKYKQQSEGFAQTTLIALIREFSALQNELRYSAYERMVLEVCTIKLCSPNLPAADSRSAAAPAAALPARERPVPAAAPPPRAESPPQAATPAHAPPPAAAASANPSNPIQAKWQNFCGEFSMMLKQLLLLCTVESEGNGVTITATDTASRSYLEDNSEQIAEKLEGYFKLTTKPLINFKVGEPKKEDKQESENFRESLTNQINMPIEFE